MKFVSLRAKKNMQNITKKEKEKYQALFENMGEGLAYFEVVCDAARKPVNLRFLDVNNAYERITGLRREEIVNKTAAEVFPQFDDYWMEYWKEVILTGSPRKFENYLKDLGVFISANVFEPEKGQIAVIFSDVTEERNQKERLIAANKELIAVNTLRDKLFTVITNDIREPLTVLVNLSELLAEEMKNDVSEKGEIVGEIQKYVRNAFAMVDNLVEWFRTKKGGEVFSPMNLDLPKLLQEAMQMNKAKAEAKGIRVISNVQDGTMVYADKEMLDIVLKNLLSNAVKYTFRNGSVIITADEDKEKVVVSVKDTGVGIRPEKVQMLFQDVQDNATNGTDGEKGIGIGLFICRKFIERNGGEIWVESTPGEGSSFFISIPAFKRL